jgi:hypothetical protein
MIKPTALKMENALRLSNPIPPLGLTGMSTILLLSGNTGSQAAEYEEEYEFDDCPPQPPIKG